jgi:hypothetical protein
LTYRVYTSSSTSSTYSNFLSINSKKYIDNNYFKIPQLHAGLPTSTSYFFALANQRQRKKQISCLEENGVILDDTDVMIKHAVNFYKKKLFGKEARSNIKLGVIFGKRVRKSKERKT